MNLPALARRAYLSNPVQAGVRGVMIATGRERRFIDAYLSRPGLKALQIGAGANRHEGWLHTNWYPIRPWGRKSVFLDATRRFPLPDDTFDYVFSEHMIEHVPYGGGQTMLQECFRILKPDGKLRISTPDLRAMAKLLSENLDPLQREYIAWGGENYLRPDEPKTAVSMVNTCMNRWGHQFVYDEETLREAMEKAGFAGITRFRVDESDDPHLTGIDHSSKIPPGFLDLESVVLQGTKPAVR